MAGISSAVEAGGDGRERSFGPLTLTLTRIGNIMGWFVLGRIVARTVAMFSVALAFAVGVRSAPVPNAAARPFRLGALTLVSLQDGTNAMPNDGKVFGVDAGPAAFAKVLQAAGAPTDRVTVNFGALLAIMPGHVVLFDTGLGPRAHGALQASLAKANIAPGAVTDVFITHSHGDHVGGLVTAEGGSAFPKAVIRMSAKEWAFMKSDPDSARIVAVIVPQVQPFVPGAMPVPYVRTIALYGHTPGHSGYEIGSSAARLIDIGDSAHSSIVSLAEPGWINGYDQDAAKGRANRLATLAKLARSHELVFAPHFPLPGVGTIAAKGSGYVWQPGVPSR